MGLVCNRAGNIHKICVFNNGQLYKKTGPPTRKNQCRAPRNSSYSFLAAKLKLWDTKRTIFVKKNFPSQAKHSLTHAFSFQFYVFYYVFLSNTGNLNCLSHPKFSETDIGEIACYNLRVQVFVNLRGAIFTNKIACHGVSSFPARNSLLHGSHRD